MISKIEHKFPIGYHIFHEHPSINYKLNRLITNGGRFEEIKEVGAKINDFDDWKREFVLLAEKALSEDRFLNAAIYYRAAEFFVSLQDPDKHILYDKFIELIYKVHEDLTGIRVEIPYENSFLPAYHFKNEERKGTIVIFGGYDSFIEEFYNFYAYIRDEGYEVITAADGYKLLEKIESEKPDLVILDIKMAGYDGLDLLQKIRNRFYNLPIILCSAYDSFKGAIQSFAADFYVVKSSDLSELKKAISRALGSTVPPSSV